MVIKILMLIKDNKVIVVWICLGNDENVIKFFYVIVVIKFVILVI